MLALEKAEEKRRHDLIVEGKHTVQPEAQVKVNRGQFAIFGKVVLEA